MSPRAHASWPRRTSSAVSCDIVRAVSRSIYALPMASAERSRRVKRVVGYPPLSELSDLQRREFHEALVDADTFEDLPGKWQTAILKAEQSRPNRESSAATSWTFL